MTGHSSEALYQPPTSGGEAELEVTEGEWALKAPGERRRPANGRMRRFTPNGDGARQVMGYSIGGVADGVALEPDDALSFAPHNPVGAAIKRGFDVIASALAIILLSPLWLAIALAIKLDTRGPVLFRQQRIGRNGRSFQMFKFRTMVDGADAQKPNMLHLNEAGPGLFKISKDPRMTAVGRFLRSTCLDEIPQLIHVLTGRMSLVGPRPLVPEEDQLVDGAYRRRLTMRPGLTGVWQTAGGARSIPLGRMAELDAHYVENWSLAGDLRILLRTFPLVIRRAGI
jgi:lipopolysaccharide/colanic/teichoic acid biosynthesis glycosyltransferase